MGPEIHFIGAGDFGCEVFRKLSGIYEGTRAELIDKNGNASPQQLGIHVFPFAETACLDGKDRFIIMAGSVHDRCWMEARNTLHESRPYLMATIGIEHGRGIDQDTFQPFPEECIVFPDPSLFDPVEAAQLILQIFFIHTPWNESSSGSLIGYDLADTKQLFAGKVVKVIKMTADKEHYKQNFSEFLAANMADLSRAQGILMSFWVLFEGVGLQQVHELYEEAKCLLMPDINELLTIHTLHEDVPDLATIIFFMTF